MFWRGIPQERCAGCFAIIYLQSPPITSFLWTAAVHTFLKHDDGEIDTLPHFDILCSCPLKELLAQGVSVSQCWRIQFFYKQKPVISWLMLLVNHYILFNHIKEIAYLSMQITSFPVVWYPILFQYVIWTISNANHEVIASISQNGWSWGSYLGVHSQ